MTRIGDKDPPPPAIPAAVVDPVRLAAVRATGLLDAPAQDSWDGLTAVACRLLRAPMAFLTLVDESRSFWLSCTGLDTSGSNPRQNAVEESFCQYVIVDRAPFVARDAEHHPRTRDNPSVDLLGVRAWAGFPLTDSAGHVLGSFCVMDIVTRADWSAEDIETLGVLARAASAQVALVNAVQAEREARAVQERADRRGAAVLDAMPIGYVTLARDWRITFANDHAAATIGTTPADLIGRRIWDILPADPGRRFEQTLRRVAVTGHPESVDAHTATPAERFAEVFVAPTDDGLSLFVVDRTEQQAERARADQILDSMPVGYTTLDREWRYTYLNERAVTLSGAHDARDLLGVDYWEQFPAAVGSEIETVFRRVAATGRSETFRTYYPAPLDTDFDLHVAVHGDQLAVFALDVSAERRLEARSDRILASMPVGYLAYDGDFRITAANDEAARLVGSTVEALVGHRLWDLFPATVGTEFETVYRRVAATGGHEVFEFHYPEPLNAWYEIRVWGDPPGLFVYFVDVSSRRHAQERLEQAAAHDRTVAQTLQSVLHTALPASPDVELVTRYRTAVGGDTVGGDWHDALVHPDGSLTLVIGDVMGHDIRAAAMMGQLRAMLRAFTWAASDRPPGEVVAQLDRASRDLQLATMASVAVVRLEAPRAHEAGTRTLRWSNAGHPPPLVLERDGTTRRLDADPADPLLGVAPQAVRHDRTIDIAPGATVLLYTDGLVESRVADIDDGIERLRASLRTHHGLGLQDLVDAVLRDLVAGDPTDDIAVIAARIPALPANR